MKRVIFILNLILLSFLHSQSPVITRENYFKIGDQSTKNRLSGGNITFLTVQDSGESLTWDFSNLYSITENENIDTILILDPTKTPFFNQACVEYNKSTICYVVDFNQLHNLPDRDYHYYTVDDQKVEYLGYWSDSYVAEMDCNHYSDPLTELKFPLTYGSNYEDNYNNTWWDYILLEYINWIGVYKLSANAYGTLILPENNIYDKVLMLKTTKNFRKISSKGERSYSYVSYIWYSETHRGPLLVLSRNNAGELVEAYLYKNYIYTRVENQKGNGNFDIQLYPNPASSEIHIRLPTESKGYSLKIYDVLGRLIKCYDDFIGEEISLDKTLLPSGIYFLHLSDGIKINTIKKFIMTK